MPNQNYAEDEINLRDYINTILKRKKLILSVFFVAVVTTAVVSFLMPKVYEVSMLIEPGNLETTEKGEKLYLDTGIIQRV